MKIVEIKEYTPAPFGCGQLSHEPRDYYSGHQTGWRGFDRCAKVADIICDTGMVISVYSVVGDYGISIQHGGWSMPSNKLFVNTVSPQALATHAERVLRDFERSMHEPMSKLKAARLMEGKSQQDVAKAAGISYVTLSRYESGEADIKKAAFGTVLRLAEVLQRDPADLI